MSREDLFVAMSGRRYRVERFWGTLPDGMELGLVSMLAVGPHGSVAVATRNGPPVVVFDADGMFRTAWPEEGVADPHGINFTHDGRVILVDRDAHEIQFRTLEGERVATLGRRHHPAFQAPFNHPTSAFAAKDGDIYVADGYGNNVVHRFAADGSLISTWGGAGTGPGEFSTPHSVLVDQLDRVLVVDRENNRVQVFDRDGAYLDSWGGFYHPMDITQDEDGFVYVSDQIPRLHQLNSDGHRVGQCRPVWNTPHGVACGPNHVIYLAEMNPSSITRLVPVDD